MDFWTDRFFTNEYLDTNHSPDAPRVDTGITWIRNYRFSPTPGGSFSPATGKRAPDPAYVSHGY